MIMNQLFTTGDFSAINLSNLNSMKAEIESFGQDYLHNTNEEELTNYLNDKYRFNELELFPDNIEIIDKGETNGNL